MEYKPIQLKKNNRLALNYANGQPAIQQYFHYRPFDDDEVRLDHIQTRNYERDELSDILLNMNRSWGADEQTLAQIKRLKSPESTVVIGGQQAGLLTGPIYTINKIISIVKLAREKEKILKVPVIPVFWIAGEDHDFDEINHIFSLKKNQNQNTYKHMIRQHETIKKSVSDIAIDKNAAKDWLKQFLNDLPETAYTSDWYDETILSLQHSYSYTDFFARLIFQLFQDEGIVLVDAHDKNLRQHERAHFELLLAHQQEISEHVHAALEELKHQGYPVALDIEEKSANLFYHDEHGERILLQRDQEHWTDKHDEVLKTTPEILSIAKNEPWRLSTNVITRPIMQELLFPTLAFIAGDGEISYWATLKRAFEAVGLEVPPVVPRLSITYISKRIEKLLNKRVLQPETVIGKGTGELKQQWLFSQESVPLESLFENAKKSMDDIHAPLRNYALSISPDLGGTADKNMMYIEQQMDYLKKEIIKKIETKHYIVLRQFDELENALRPNGGLQERIWNPYMLINQYGKDFIKMIIEDTGLSFKHDHYAVYLGE